MAPVPGVGQIPGGKPPVDDLRVTGEANRHGGIVMGFQQCHNPGNGSVLKIIFQNKRFSHFHQLGRGVVQNVHGRCAQLNLFCPAVKAQIVKQHLLDGVLGQHWNSQRLRNPDGDGALAAGGHTGNQNAVHGVSS